MLREVRLMLLRSILNEQHVVDQVTLLLLMKLRNESMSKAYSPIFDDHSPISWQLLCEVLQYIADASAHPLLMKNKLQLISDASVLKCRIYCECRHTYAVIILQSRYTLNVRTMSGNVHRCIGDHAEIIRRSRNLFQHHETFQCKLLNFWQCF